MFVLQAYRKISLLFLLIKFLFLGAIYYISITNVTVVIVIVNSRGAAHWLFLCTIIEKLIYTIIEKLLVTNFLQKISTVSTRTDKIEKFTYHWA